MSDSFDKKKANQIGFAFSLVLNDSSADLFHDSRRLMNKIISQKQYQIKFVAVAFHDLDVNEFGDKKTNHYHVVIEFMDRLRLISCFNWIVDLFHCNENQVQIEKCSDVGSQARYLIHLDDADKYQYLPSIVVCNNADQLDFYYKRFYVRDEEDLVNIVERNPSKKRLFLVLGEKQYKKYRYIIHDLLNY